MNFFSKIFGSKEESKTGDGILIDGIDTNGKPSDENTPWIRIEGVPIENGQIRIEADWTEGLITHLRKKHGYVGADDDAIAHKFIAEMHAQLMNDMDGNYE